jgi:hypothetical protein
MDTSTISLSSEAIKLLPVFAGGVLAILGGAGSQYLIYCLNKSRDRNLLLREKAEALVKALYANNHWLDTKRNNLLFREKDHEEPPPLDEARMIQRLYFPELSPFVKAIIAAQSPMVAFLYEQRSAQLKDKEAWLNNNNLAPFGDMFAQYLNAFHSCVEQVGIHVQKQING